MYYGLEESIYTNKKEMGKMAYNGHSTLFPHPQSPSTSK
jgi:hypothetical protein